MLKLVPNLTLFFNCFLHWIKEDIYSLNQYLTTFYTFQIETWLFIHLTWHFVRNTFSEGFCHGSSSWRRLSEVVTTLLLLSILSKLWVREFKVFMILINGHWTLDAQGRPRRSRYPSSEHIIKVVSRFKVIIFFMISMNIGHCKLVDLGLPPHPFQIF